MAEQRIGGGITGPVDSIGNDSDGIGLTVTADRERAVRLCGRLDKESAGYFSAEMDRLFAEAPDARMILNAKALRLITSAGADAIRRMADRQRRFVFDELNQECYAALYTAGLTAYAGRHVNIPVIDISSCPKQGEGSNGIVYRLNEEIIVKVFKKAPDFDALLKEWHISRQAFLSGIPCPISFGAALVDGRLALMFEMIETTSFAKLVQKDRSNIRKYMGDYVNLIRRLHGTGGDQLLHFPRNVLMAELLQKAERLQGLLGTEYTSIIRTALQSVDEPEVLTHGDIQPSNIRIGDAGAGFIDMETLSTGPEIIDIGGLRRTLFSDWEYYDRDYSSFLRLPADVCVEIWEAFIERYYSGEPRDSVRAKMRMAEIISLVLAAAKALKQKDDPMDFDACAARLKALADAWVQAQSEDRV